LSDFDEAAVVIFADRSHGGGILLATCSKDTSSGDLAASPSRPCGGEVAMT